MHGRWELFTPGAMNRLHSPVKHDIPRPANHIHSIHHFDQNSIGFNFPIRLEDQTNAGHHLPPLIFPFLSETAVPNLSAFFPSSHNINTKKIKIDRNLT
jgi:hypothetical protein